MTAPVQAPPDAAAAFYRAGQRITGAGILAVRALWRQFDPRAIDASFTALLPNLVATFGALQVAAARTAAEYTPAVLEEVGLDAPAAGRVRPVSFIGAPSGVTLPEMLTSVPIQAKAAAAAGGSLDVIEAQGLRLVEGMLRTSVADAARQATSVDMAARPRVSGYVRMLNPPACGRCVILAGRWYRWSSGFQRHPGCDCRHIPAAEDTSDDLRTDPRAYFRGLSSADQDRAFGSAGAQAVRDGADLSQVVNARRGMSTAQVFGRQVRATSEGTTSRGVFGRGRADLAKRSGDRYRRSGTIRLMPESIYKLATDRDDAIRLLRLYGYIT